MRHLILTIVALSGCHLAIDSNGDGDNNESNNDTFTRVDNQSNAGIVLVDQDHWDYGDETWHVDCDGDDDLDFSVDNDELVIVGDSSACDVSVIVHGGDSITINGDGDCDAHDTLELDDLALFVRGNGAVHIDDLQSDNLTLDLSGTGDVTIAGATDTADFTISGDGTLLAGDLVIGDLTITMSGSGEATVNVTGTITGDVTGSGSLTVLGDPEGEVTVTGSGVVIGLE
jgi:hypothetical protein